jgi:hypothetical protein
VLVVLVLAGTAAAFAVTESMKLETAPITATKVDKIFSPVCRCSTRVAHIRFRLSRRNRLQVSIVHGGKLVRTLEPGQLYGPGPKHFEWNGRDAAGRVVADGSYDPRVRVGGQTISLPNPIQVDTVRPRAHLVGVTGSRVLHIRYRLSERGHALLYDGARRVVYTRFQRPTGTITYRAAGPVALSLGAVDLAGNLAARVPVRLPQ